MNSRKVSRKDFSAIFALLTFFKIFLMNKNTIIGFILIIGILIGYSLWLTPSKEEMAARQHQLDSIAQVRQAQKVIDSIQFAAQKALEEKNTQTTVILSDTNAVVDNFQQYREKFGSFANAVEGEDKDWMLENDVLKMTINSRGGFVKSVELKDYITWDSLPLILFDPNTSLFDLNFFAQNRSISSSQFYFKPYLNGQPYTGNESLSAKENDSLVFGMRLMADDVNGIVDPSKYIEYQYIVKSGEYMVDFNINVVGMQDLIAANTRFMNLNWHVDIQKQERIVDRFNGSTIYYKFLKDDDIDYLSETSDEEEFISTKLKWVSFKQRFFSSSIIAHNQFDNANITTKTINSKNPRYLKSMYADLEIPYESNQEVNLSFSFYFGPNNYYTLRSYDLDLERQIPLGWSFFLMAWINIYIVIPVFNFLGSYGWNYGIVILVLTILLKIILLPIAFKTYMSSAKMRVLKPDVDAISEKYPKQDDAMKKQQAIMNLYKSAGASPMSGCVPMLLQMPILLAMFRFFPSSIELRQQPFLWATDLSSFDSILDLPFTIPFYGDHVSLFTLLMTVSTIIYTKVNNQMMGQQSNQMPSMKAMMYLMPIMFLGIFNDYAAGLSYYYLLANLITFAQMYIFRLAINEDKLRAKMEENKKKPIKKSSFQKRLEEAQRAQQQQLKNRRK